MHVILNTPSLYTSYIWHLNSAYKLQLLSAYTCPRGVNRAPFPFPHPQIKTPLTHCTHCCNSPTSHACDPEHSFLTWVIWHLNSEYKLFVTSTHLYLRAGAGYSAPSLSHLPLPHPQIKTLLTQCLNSEYKLRSLHTLYAGPRVLNPSPSPPSN